ncbi:capsule biosynthesis protein [Methylobacterium oryzihabitans]|uniref:Capsule biosynthesis protein n=1 Tax=Methylobacterium oryzihabitans TaxID=2499852 RepID=A0A437P189_9HYPH|nr:capsule biosynthesis protein [Methylobacterium oryzihabitans]RVU16006.1 capsule biosynthesis protein [Methylobacterium oryzihabitans]
MTVDARNPEGQPLSPADRSRMISQSLRQMARVSRFSDPKKGMRAIRAQGRRDIITPILFVALFVIPALAGAAFYGLYLSDRYVTETRFAIRPAVGGAEKATPDQIGTSSGVPKELIAQDTAIVLDYVESRPMVEAVEKVLPVREMFSRSSIDAVSRFDPDLPIEKLVRYWQKRVEVRVEGTSGIVVVTVNAFAPEDALALAKAVVAEAERMVNDLTQRSRNDALAESDREMARAEEKLTRLHVAVRDLRNRDGVLDAEAVNDANLKMLGEIRSVRINLAVKLNLLQRDLREDTRTIQDLKAQIAQLDEQIGRIERQATTQDPQQRKVLADTLTRFEQLDEERKTTEKFYAATIAARERSRMIADRQIEFFSLVVAPVLPESAQQPRRLLWMSLVVAGAGVVFGLAMLIRRSID